MHKEGEGKRLLEIYHPFRVCKQANMLSKVSICQEREPFEKTLAVKTNLSPHSSLEPTPFVVRSLDNMRMFTC